MKKLFCALLILSLIALCAIAETDYTGEWYLNEVRFGEMTLSPSLYGKDVTLSLNADGTAQMKSSEEGVDQINDGSWAQNESGLTLTIEGSPLVFTPDADGNLIADISDEACDFQTLKARLEALSQKLGVEIRVQRSEIFEAMHQI